MDTCGFRTHPMALFPQLVLMRLLGSFPSLSQKLRGTCTLRKKLVRSLNCIPDSRGVFLTVTHCTSLEKVWTEAVGLLLRARLPGNFTVGLKLQNWNWNENGSQFHTFSSPDTLTNNFHDSLLELLNNWASRSVDLDENAHLFQITTNPVPAYPLNSSDWSSFLAATNNRAATGSTTEPEDILIGWPPGWPLMAG